MQERETEPEPAIELEAPQSAPGVVTASVATDPEAEAKAFIYSKESSNRLEAVNPYGCIGLGQDCNGQLHLECPNWRTDYGCQDDFWERYMQRRYGSWQAAKAHWLARVPIDGRDVGHWW